mmetsp:Transcript_9789/g.16186  ORF Transcript_9789/g.16186 Transcript_9789/m.16186 type:complete len:814 (+) Transcript_9789:131-2572(+)
MPSNYNGRGPKKSSDGKMADKFREICPTWKVKDLDALVKQCKGDEDQISAKISEWWDEGEPKRESEWEAVDRKSTKKTTEKKSSGGGSRNDRGAKSSGGGGGERRGDRVNGSRGEGGRGVRDRGEGRGGRSSGRFGGDRRGGDKAAAQPKKAAAQPAPAATTAAAPAAPKQEPAAVSVPTPVTAAPAPKGAWGATSFANIAAAPAPKRAAPQPVPPPEPQQPEVSEVPLEQEQVTVDLTPEPVNMLSPEDPTPSGLPTSSALPPAASTSGNVWGAKGGAHLIAAAKAKPIPPQAPTIIEPEEPALVAVEVEEPIAEPEPEQDLIQESSFGVSLDSVLPASVNGANINASGWEPIIDASESTKPSVEITHSSSLPEPEPVPVPISQPAAPAAPTGVKPSNVLNMGHWETGDDNDGDLDFGFGSFAPENDDVAAETKTSQAPPSTTETAAPAAPQPSPARPPPGLSMPGIPAGATFVHELETKLENTTLAPKTEDKPAQETKTQSQPQSFSNDLGGHMNSGMPQYGGMGMYGMPPGVPSALGNMPQFQNAPNLGGAVNQQQPKTETANQGQQQGPYGMMQSTTSTANNASGASGSDNNNTSTNNNAAMPPGMPGMQYPNPAFMYGQYNHPYGMQYGYGQQFGQFGGYSQVMGQGGGYPYGAPSHHDDRNRGGNMRDNYQKGGRGGYRGNRNNNNQYGNNQYGNNYQGMGGGYGAAPTYNMGYGHGGGYGQPGAPSGMDHYAMQQGGFNQQNNDHNKGKPSGSDGNQQFQQQSHLHQQPLGLQGSTNDSSNTGGSGWSSGPSAGGQNWGGNWQRDN